MNQNAEDWIPTRQSLFSRLRDWDDKESWEDFFTTYRKSIYNVLRKSGLHDAEAQEVVQETIIHVAKQPLERHGRLSSQPHRDGYFRWAARGPFAQFLHPQSRLAQLHSGSWIAAIIGMT